MWKYVAMAAAARAFSINGPTKALYRRLGNVVLGRMRVADGLPERYVDRATNLVRTCEKNRILRPGDHVLELGTGWVHWEATVLRLFYDVEVTLFDVCDNRLFTALRCYLDQLDGRLDQIGSQLGLPAARMAEARSRLDAAREVESFDELYELMHFRYRLDPAGMLDGLPESQYALIVSADVLEHVDDSTLPAYLARCLALLEPGGYSLHQIDLVDHFHYFDPSCSPKHFYRYDDETWRRYWDSDVQYVNRVQRPQWRRLFERAGFTLLHEERVSAPLGSIPRSTTFDGLTQEDVDCLQLVTLHRRPEVVVPGPRTSSTAEATGRAVSPAVSVCLPVREDDRRLGRAIGSVLTQTLTDLEILVLVDGSAGDASRADVAASFDDPRVRIEYTGAPTSPTEHRNRAVAGSRAPLVKLMSADDVLHPVCLELQVAALDAADDVALVVGRAGTIDGAGQALSSGTMPRGLVGSVHSNTAIRAIVRHGGNPIGPPASALFRRADFDRVGGFGGTDPSVDDLDLWTRLLAHGRLVGMRDPVVSCGVHPDGGRDASSRAEFDGQRALTAELAESPAWQVQRRDVAVGAIGARATLARRRTVRAVAEVRARSTPPGQAPVDG